MLIVHRYPCTTTAQPAPGLRCIRNWSLRQARWTPFGTRAVSFIPDSETHASLVRARTSGRCGSLENAINVIILPLRPGLALPRTRRACLLVDELADAPSIPSFTVPFVIYQKIIQAYLAAQKSIWSGSESFEKFLSLTQTSPPDFHI